MKPRIIRLIQAVLLMLLTIILEQGWLPVAYAFPVPELPDDNLVVNPWFRSASNPAETSFDGWTRIYNEDVSWGPSQKEANPSPDIVVAGACGFQQVYCGTAARWAEQSGILYPNVDVYAYQIVAADLSQRKLKFFAHYVSHRVEVGAVNIYGSDSADGPWTLLWVPLFHSQQEQIVPESRGQEELWEETGFLETSVERGYPYYKIELHARLPEWHMIRGVGFKITGIYFATEITDEPGMPPSTPNLAVTATSAAAAVVTPVATPAVEATAVVANTGTSDSEDSGSDRDEVADAGGEDPNVITLAVKTLSSTTVTLSWDGSENNSRGFRLERRLSGGANWHTIAGFEPLETGYTDRELTPGTVYYYRLRVAQHEFSNEVLVTTLPPSGDAYMDSTPVDNFNELDQVDETENAPGQRDQSNLTQDSASAKTSRLIYVLAGVLIVVVLTSVGFLLGRSRH